MAKDMRRYRRAAKDESQNIWVAVVGLPKLSVKYMGPYRWDAKIKSKMFVPLLFSYTIKHNKNIKTTIKNL